MQTVKIVMKIVDAESLFAEPQKAVLDTGTEKKIVTVGINKAVLRVGAYVDIKGHGRHRIEKMTRTPQLSVMEVAW